MKGEWVTLGTTRTGNLGDPANFGIGCSALLAGGEPGRFNVMPNVEMRRPRRRGAWAEQAKFGVKWLLSAAPMDQIAVPLVGLDTHRIDDAVPDLLLRGLQETDLAWKPVNWNFWNRLHARN